MAQGASFDLFPTGAHVRQTIVADLMVDLV